MGVIQEVGVIWVLDKWRNAYKQRQQTDKTYWHVFLYANKAGLCLL